MKSPQFNRSLLTLAVAAGQFASDGGSEPTLAEVKEAFDLLQGEVKKLAPNQERIEVLQKALDKYDEANQKLVTDFKSAEAKALEFKERIDALEAEMARSGGPGEGKDYKQTPEYKALAQFVKAGDLSSEEKALLRTDNDVQGGYLVMSEMDSAITKEITEISPIRSIARVRTVSAKTLQVPVRSGIPDAEYEGEAEQDDEGTSTYRSESLTAFRLSVTVPITQDMLMDSSFNMESEIMSDAAERFAQKEGNKFVLGTGVKQPSGFVSDARVQADARTSAASGVVDFADTMLLTGDLKTGYNPVYVMNRRTLAYLRTLVGTDGHPIWQPGMNGAVMSTINGHPYIIANDMPDIAAGAFPIAFGDFMRGYTIIDRTGLSVVRDEVTRKRHAITEFTLHRWNTGQVILPEAIKLLKVKS